MDLVQLFMRAFMQFFYQRIRLKYIFEIVIFVVTKLLLILLSKHLLLSKNCLIFDLLRER